MGEKDDFIELFGEPNTSNSETVEIIDKSLLKKNTIFLEGDVDEDSINDVIRRLLYISQNNKKPITIRLCTDGGDCYESIRLYDAVRRIKNKVNIVACGRVFSAGVFILACCATGTRAATRYTSFMTHEVSGWSIGKFSDMKVNLKETERVQKVMNSLIAKHSKLSLKEVKAMDVKDNYFDARLAKKIGIIDKVI